ncbi:MAG: hypothetical protein NUV67_05670 [archaeon]|nr:hypothetical protein [archaeon]
MPEPIIENSLWQKAVKHNNELKAAVMNPNTDFMTKLLFDARIFQKRKGKETAYWSNLIFKTKFLLSQKKALTPKQIASLVIAPEAEIFEILAYLLGMAEVKEAKGKYSLNYSNPFSKIFEK